MQLPLLQTSMGEGQQNQDHSRLEPPKSEAMGIPFMHGPPPPGLPFLPPHFPMPNLHNFPNFPNLPNLPNINLAALANLPNFPGMPNPFLGLPLPFPPPGSQNNMPQALQQLLGQLPPQSNNEQQNIPPTQLQGTPLIQASPNIQQPTSTPQPMQPHQVLPVANQAQSSPIETEAPAALAEEEPEIIIEREKRRYFFFLQ